MELVVVHFVLAPPSDQDRVAAIVEPVVRNGEARHVIIEKYGPHVLQFRKLHMPRIEKCAEGETKIETGAVSSCGPDG